MLLTRYYLAVAHVALACREGWTIAVLRPGCRHTAWLAGVGVALVCIAGCGPTGGIYDGETLAAAKSLIVLPGVGAPGPDGANAGRMQSGLLITSLANLDYFKIEGPARMRKALAAAGGGADKPLSPRLQADLAKGLKAALLVLTEVLDYRFTKQTKSQDWYFGTSTWTETTYWVTTALRFVRPADGKLVFAGTGEGQSKAGYGPAVLIANENALKELKQFVVQQKQRRKQGLEPGTKASETRTE